jgi:asparagine synthase (glutamine-hydrolysing)
MGGICGILSRDGSVDEESLKRMRDAMVHRGPDDAGLFLSQDRNAGLGERRLNVSKMEVHNPLPVCNEDRTVWMICDGEFYNLPDLKRSLEWKGHRFQSGSDAEVIVHLYEETNEDCVSQLDGRFSFALWDAKRNTLYLGRDRLGEKPLYYTWDAKRFLFASELKAILTDTSVSRDIDAAALHDYLNLQYIPHPNTILEGIKKLPPSHTLTFREGRVQIRPYWRLAARYDGLQKEDDSYEEEFSCLLYDSVRKRLASGAPIGILLNGRLSAGTIAAIMSDSLNGDLKSFSFGVKGEEDEDSAFDHMFADAIGCDHQDIMIEPVDAAEIIPRISRQFDEPLANHEAVATLLMAEMIRNEVRVCFSDEGTDVILGGCERHEIALKRKALFDSLVLDNADIAGDLMNSLAPSFDHYVTSQYSFLDDEIGRLLHPDIRSDVIRNKTERSHHFPELFDEPKHQDYMSALQRLDIGTSLADNVNVKTDRMNMLASLEMRRPMIDYKLAEFTLSLPQNYKVRSGIQNYILRKAMKKRLPDALIWNLNRKRSGSFNKLLNGKIDDYAKGLLLTPNCRHFRQGYVNGLLNDGWQEDRMRSSRVWTLIMFEEWRRIYKA